VLELLLVPGDEVVVDVFELLELLEPLAGDAWSFTTVVLLLLPAGGLFVSDFCSQAASNAALAIMQMSFFIVGLVNPLWVNDLFAASILFGLPRKQLSALNWRFVRKRMRLRDRRDRQLPVARVDAADQRRLQRASAFQAMIR
jgi:hypothetical protein